MLYPSVLQNGRDRYSDKCSFLERVAKSFRDSEVAVGAAFLADAV